MSATYACMYMNSLPVYVHELSYIVPCPLAALYMHVVLSYVHVCTCMLPVHVLAQCTVYMYSICIYMYN